MLTYQYYMPKSIDLTSNWDKQGNVIFIIITHFQKTRITCQFMLEKKDIYAVYHFTKRFRKIWLENISNTTFWVIPAENFREQRNI